jgi:hypothetical protein
MRKEDAMTEISSSTVVCRLDALGEAERLRQQALRSALHEAVTETQELPDGYALRLTADPALFLHVAEWVTLERRCCPFLSFALDWPAGGAAWLRLTGGPDVKTFLAAEVARRAV